MNFGKFILQKASKDLILTINETWVAEVIFWIRINLRIGLYLWMMFAIM